MIRVRRSASRGHVRHGWLEARHTFSFGSYHDPAHMGFRSLRVMNEDVFQPRSGFGMHPHRDMEIVTYVLSGALTHEDSLGNVGTIEAGEFQRMTAGTGIRHAERNQSATEPVHLYQIWLHPRREGLQPGYEQRRFPDDELRDALRPVATPDGRDDSLVIQQDASIHLGRLTPGSKIVHSLGNDRHAWVQVLRGEVGLDEHVLNVGDGAAVSGVDELRLQGIADAEVLVFDLV